MKIDLHTHSIRSDGSDEPAALIEAAAAAGLDVVALTDHDTVAGWDEAQESADRVGVRLVRGIEFSVTDIDSGRHLLGYNVDPANADVADILGKAATSRADRAVAVLDRLEDLGKGVDREWVAAQAGGIPSRNHIAHGMVRARWVSSTDEAFATYLNEGLPGYVQRYRPTIEEAIAAINAAGGAAVVAHPRDGKRGGVVSDERFEELKDDGLRGIEVDHEQHGPGVRADLRAIADRLGLAATGSSDYHGARKQGHDLGCNTTPYDVAAELLGW